MEIFIFHQKKKRVIVHIKEPVTKIQLSLVISLLFVQFNVMKKEREGNIENNYRIGRKERKMPCFEFIIMNPHCNEGNEEKKGKLRGRRRKKDGKIYIK